MANCRYCDAEIRWVNEEGRWVPHDEENDAAHRCTEGRSARAAPKASPAQQRLPVQPAPVVADPYDLITAMNRLAAEIKELRRVIEETRTLVG